MTGLAGCVACHVVYIRMPGCGEHDCLPFHATVTNGGRNHPYVCERLVLVALQLLAWAAWAQQLGEGSAVAGAQAFN